MIRLRARTIRNSFVGIAVFISIFIWASCAHKAAPLSKDRLNPKLQKVSALNNRQIQFTFSEILDTLNLKPEYFSILSEEETLKIMTLYPSLSASEIIAITEIQFDKVYEVSGYVFDTAQNKGNFKESFIGSSKPDTITPWIVNYSKGANHKEFSLIFSEAMDTTFLTFFILPKNDLKPEWQNLRACHLIPEIPDDSLSYDTTYYLYIDKGARDINGNTIDIFITSITPDTIYKPIILKGTAHVNDTLIKTGLAVLKRKYPIGITLVDHGDFSFEVRDSLFYTIEVISGKYSGSAEVSVDRVNNIILKLEEKDIDSLIN
ncbi:hypothetical protein KAX97_09640 [candidate division WOR-3 bacterium]|nr:hypothetical protein [candidate division WOR-3 bacterium]